MNYTYQFPRPALSADIAVFRHNGTENEILLIRRKNPPYQGMWAFPGGFMEIDETLEQCAARELDEETGLAGVSLSQFRAYSNVDRDPRTRVVTMVFFGITDYENSVVNGGDDAEEAAWFPLSALPACGFDHGKIIQELRTALTL